MRHEELIHYFTRWIQSRTNRDSLRLLKMKAPPARQAEVQELIDKNAETIIMDADLAIYGLLFTEMAPEERAALKKRFQSEIQSHKGPRNRPLKPKTVRIKNKLQEIVEKKPHESAGFYVKELWTRYGIKAPETTVRRLLEK